MKIREYARHRGCSHVAVLDAIKSGKLIKAVSVDSKGNKSIDPEIADQEWTPGQKEIFKEHDPNKSSEETQANLNVASSYAKARAVRENFQARLAQLEYEEAAGKLVDAETVKNQWVQVASIVRTKILGVPAKARQRIPELTNDAYLVLETIIREALEELSDGGD